MNSENTSLKLTYGHPLTQLIRQILYNRKLNRGAKLLALVLLDLPKSAEPSNASLAKKIYSNPSQISLWRQELIRNGFKIRIPNIPASTDAPPL